MARNAIFERRSTQTITALKPFEEGRSVTKLHEMICQKFSGTSFGDRRPRGILMEGLSTLTGQAAVDVFVAVFGTVGHQKSR